jgi:deoxyribodipyrimidine photo-lyase
MTLDEPAPHPASASPATGTSPSSGPRPGPPSAGGVHPLRVETLNQAPVVGSEEGARYVVYWMTAFRRLEWNHALEQAVAWSRHLGLPLLVFEPLRMGYAYQNLRHHRFCVDGMEEHLARLEGQRTGYFPYVEPEAGAGKGLLAALARRAALVVTDDAPHFFLPRMRAAAARALPVRLEAVDSNGLLPLRQPGRDFTTAYSFRRHLHKFLPPWLEEAPAEHPLAGDPLPAFGDPAAPMGARLREVLGQELLDRWPAVTPTLLADRSLSGLPLNRAVPPVPFRGGREEASRRLARFLEAGLPGYVEGRNHPDRSHATGLSPHLHWGHISSHEIVHAVLDREGYRPALLAAEVQDRKADGRREGWWGLSADAEAFLDQVITWRELGVQGTFRYAAAGEDPEAWETLPGWARETLGQHRDDPRPHLYDRDAFEAAETHDPLWNAAQRELRREGTIHNYLRMLWGKKILEWTESPEEALAVMVYLNHTWGVDGRDPNSTSGIMWTLGRYDRGWPERAVYGKVRSMTSDSTRRKVDLDDYLARFGAGNRGEG